MRSIAFLSQKGGSGKTTLAVHIPVTTSKHERVIIIDTDPRAPPPPGGRHPRANRLRFTKPPTFRAHRDSPQANGASLAIVDTPPHAIPGVDIVASAIDLLLIPCRPSAFDLVAMSSSIQVAKARENQCGICAERV